MGSDLFAHFCCDILLCGLLFASLRSFSFDDQLRGVLFYYAYLLFPQYGGLMQLSGSTSAAGWSDTVTLHTPVGNTYVDALVNRSTQLDPGPQRPKKRSAAAPARRLLDWDGSDYGSATQKPSYYTRNHQYYVYNSVPANPISSQGGAAVYTSWNGVSYTSQRVGAYSLIYTVSLNSPLT